MSSKKRYPKLVGMGYPAHSSLTYQNS